MSRPTPAPKQILSCQEFRAGRNWACRDVSISIVIFHPLSFFTLLDRMNKKVSPTFLVNLKKKKKLLRWFYYHLEGNIKYLECVYLSRQIPLKCSGPIILLYTYKISKLLLCSPFSEKQRSIKEFFNSSSLKTNDAMRDY